MVEAYAKGQPTPNRRVRLIRLLYQALGRVPERTNLRLLLAENLLDLGDYEEAEREATKLIETDATESPVARKIIALSMFARAQATTKSSIADELTALVEAVKELPGDVRLATVAAMALRQHPTAIELEDKDPATYADQIMDQLVAANPKSVDALIARYRYRVQYQLPDDACDLQSALKISPDHVEALLMSAEAALTQGGQSQQVETLLRRARDAAPDDPRPYLALARVRQQDGRSNEALDVLRQAYARLDNRFELGLALAGSLITADNTSEAERVIGEVQAKSNELLVRLDASSRIQIENQLRLLRARLALAQNKPTAAIPELQGILFAAEASPALKDSSEWLQATALLAQMSEAEGLWDRAGSYWEDLAEAVPQKAIVVQSAAAAYLNAGDAPAAIRRLDSFSRLAEPTADMMVQMVQAHLMMQLARPIADRNWAEFLSVLADAKTKAKDRWELVLAEIEYLLASEAGQVSGTDSSTGGSAAAENWQRAAEILKAAERSFAGNASFWRAAALAYQRMERTQDSERALSRYLETEPSPVNHAVLQATLLSNASRFDEADELLVHLMPSLSEEESRQIQQLRVEILVAAKALPAAHQLVDTLITADPNDPNPKLLALGIGISLELGDFQAAEKWEALLGQQEPGKFEWRYLRSLRLLRSYDKLSFEEKRELASSISELRSSRPRWYPVLALAARHEQLNGDSLQALSDYRLAVDLGDHRASTIEQLVSLLYEHDRLGEAEEYLSRLTSEQTYNPNLNSLAIQLALKQDRLAEALVLARKGVEQFPDDARRYIWLANVMFRNGQSQDALDVYRQAADRFPNDSQVWMGMLTLFVNTDRAAEARETVAALLANKSLPDQSRHFLAAQGLELLGDIAEAKQHYKSALTKQPDDIVVLLRYVKLLRAENTESARKLLEEVLGPAPINGEARRELASLLAATGRDVDWTRAQKLLKSQAEDSQTDTATNDRLRAVLLSRRGRTRQQRLANCQKAHDILEQLVKSTGDESSDINRRLLASIYEQEAILGNDQSKLFAAREQLRYLVDRENPSAQNLAIYIDFLVRHATSESRSAATGDTITAAKSDDGGLRDLFLTDAESRLRDLKRAQESLPGSLANNLSSVELTVRALKARGRNDEAAKYVAQFIQGQDKESQDQNSKAQLLLMTGNLYSTLGQHAEAEKWYRRLMEIIPRTYVLVVRSLIEQGKREEAAELCLSIADGNPTPEEAAVLSFIMTRTTESNAELPEALSAIESAVATHPENADLLQAAAVMRASRGDYDEAIATFRRLIKIDPENALAMNNLATLLAERPNQQAEAFEYTERAIGIAGRLPALLDTQGTIFLKAKDYAQAISCLEEAVAGGATDARYYLHLAAAYQSANRIEDALSALQTSRKFGLKKTVLTNDDRTLLDHLDRTLGQPATPSGRGV